MANASKHLLQPLRAVLASSIPYPHQRVSLLAVITPGSSSISHLAPHYHLCVCAQTGPWACSNKHNLVKAERKVGSTPPSTHIAGRRAGGHDTLQILNPIPSLHPGGNRRRNATPEGESHPTSHMELR